MNGKILALCSLALLLGPSCTTTRTCVEADFSGKSIYKNRSSTHGQLNENDVLGLADSGKVTDKDIQRVLDETRTFRLQRGSTILLVQSGEPAPDAAMVEQLSKYFQVVPGSGLRSDITKDAGEVTLSKALRLSAAHSKAETILVFWGNLELKRNDLPTGIVSWVPVVDFMVPDEYHKMRMSLKVALLDVRTGQWATFRTEPIEQQALSTRYARAHDEKWPLESTKNRVYKNAVRKLVEQYGEKQIGSNAAGGGAALFPAFHNF
jgi:hypothetical protein